MTRIDAHDFGVIRHPLDAVPEAAPVVGVGVDAYVLDEAQLLAQLQNPFAVGGKLAIYLGGVVQFDGIIPHDLQRAAAVDPQDDGVGTGGKVGAASLIFRKGNGIGVVETGSPHFFRSKGDRAKGPR